ncbi:MAG: hypothetical protein Kow0062_09110 [Acidobacteriota bacterium]
MKVAVVYNRISQRVINLFGTPNREKYGLKNIKRITDALKAGGHQVIALEGDKDLIDRLEEFMPRVLKGERPGMVFNLSYGIQGQARYTHVPGILEMIGIPYVGSGPLAHSLALDKVVAKMIFRQSGLPTPDFGVLDTPEAALPDLPYPLIVKPKNEAVSFGIRIVEDEPALRQAAQLIFDRFGGPVLVERYIAGREVNVGLIGNNPPEALPPVELLFGGEGPAIYTFEDKSGRSGREVRLACPAPLGEELTARIQALARRAFEVLGCCDCARVDMRLDADGNPYILEINSLPSLGERGSFVAAAAAAGLDFPALVNRLVDEACARYFGMPEPVALPAGRSTPEERVFTFLTSRRDQMEHRLREWTRVSSRTGDAVGIRLAYEEAKRRLVELGLGSVDDLSDGKSAWAFETQAGLAGGILLLVALDVPLGAAVPAQAFRREPEHLHGEGIAISRAPLVMLEFVLRALRNQRRLQQTPLGVVLYADEGAACRQSAGVIRRAAERAGSVFVLRAGNVPHHAVLQRRGERTYELTVEGKPERPGRAGVKPGPLRWLCGMVEEISCLSSRQHRLSVAVVDIRASAFPLLLPHRVHARLLVSYLDAAHADAVDRRLRELLGSGNYRWGLELLSDRPPRRADSGSKALFRELKAFAQEREIPLESETSVWPSPAGLVPSRVPVICGMGPVGRDLFTPRESVQRISLVQRTLLVAQFLARGVPR